MKKTIKVSPGNTKLGLIPNISLCRKSCNKNAPCYKSGQCYAIKAYRQYPQVRVAWDNNYNLAIADYNSYWLQLSEYLEQKKPRFFRFHVCGDIIDQDYLNSMISLADLHPEVRFLCFTKKHELDFSGLPDNLCIVYSMWPGFGNTSDRMPRAWMRDKDNPDPRIPKTAIECPGNCESCGCCWALTKIHKDVVFDKH